jgi:hypothetical protein
MRTALRTLRPEAARTSHSARPMKPLAPVTSTALSALISKCGKSVIRDL